MDAVATIECTVTVIKPWDSFGVEEQAQIVEDWFKNGLKSSDPRFHYIRDNIREGAAGFVADLPSGKA